MKHHGCSLTKGACFVSEESGFLGRFSFFLVSRCYNVLFAFLPKELWFALRKELLYHASKIDNINQGRLRLMFVKLYSTGSQCELRG